MNLEKINRKKFYVLGIKGESQHMENAKCPKCGAKIIRTYENPDDPQEEYYVCENGHHNHHVKY